MSEIAIGTVVRPAGDLAAWLRHWIKTGCGLYEVVAQDDAGTHCHAIDLEWWARRWRTNAAGGKFVPVGCESAIVPLEMQLRGLHP